MFIVKTYCPNPIREDPGKNRKRKPMNAQNQNHPLLTVISRKAMLSAAVLAPILWSTSASAGTVTLVMARTTQTNVTDAGGLNQYESGDLKKGTTVIGQYQLVRRLNNPISTASTSQNVAPTSVTLLIGMQNTTTGTSGLTELHNIVLTGAHGLVSGNFKGSVSSTSNKYSWIIGADSGYVNAGAGLANLTINWNGSNQLTVP